MRAYNGSSGRFARECFNGLTLRFQLFDSAATGNGPDFSTGCAPKKNFGAGGRRKAPIDTDQRPEPADSRFMHRGLANAPR
ncbi:MAG: hypothetical protein A49_29210 [Methyloceanibacter sp.]|nr:MAG: hypothetical protein A49_29210 [Methyloceanibacter sp.]